LGQEWWRSLSTTEVKRFADDRSAREPSDQIPTRSIYFCDPEVPAEAVAMGERIMAAGGLDVGGIEYLEATDGTRVFYDVNANPIFVTRLCWDSDSIRLNESWIT
jgi:hypothetical protein